MRITRKLLKKPPMKYIKNKNNSVIGNLAKSTTVKPFSIVIPFSIDREQDLDNCLYYLNLCPGINLCEIILVLYDNQKKDYNFRRYANLTCKLIHSYRNNLDNSFCLSHAKNIGINATKNKWVLCIDCDIIIPENLCEALSFPEIRNTNTIYWTDRIQISSNKNRKSIRDLIKYKTFVDHAPYGYFYFFQKDVVIKTIGGFDETMKGWGAEDDDFIARCQRGGMYLSCVHRIVRVFHIAHKYSKKWKDSTSSFNEFKKDLNTSQNVVKMPRVGEIIKDKASFKSSEFNKEGHPSFISYGNIIRNDNFKKKFIIFGSGPNIKNLTLEKFSFLSKTYSTLGFAWFYKSGFLTDYYYCHEEISRSQQSREIIDFLQENKKYKRTVLFTTPPHVDFIKSQDFYDIPVIQVGINCYKDTFWNMNTHLPNQNIHNLWAKSFLPPHNKLFLTRTQLEAAINLAYILGAEEIVLYGVELNNNKHFCETDSSRGINVFHNELKQKVKFDVNKHHHCSTITYDNCLGVQYIIAEIDRLLKSYDIKLISGDKNSILTQTRILPYIDLF